MTTPDSRGEESKEHVNQGATLGGYFVGTWEAHGAPECVDDVVGATGLDPRASERHHRKAPTP